MYDGSGRDLGEFGGKRQPKGEEGFCKLMTGGVHCRGGSPADWAGPFCWSIHIAASACYLLSSSNLAMGYNIPSSQITICFGFY
jgi:hypothetical protein